MLKVSSQTIQSVQGDFLPCAGRIAPSREQTTTLCSASSKSKGSGSGILHFFGTLWTAIVKFLSKLSLFKGCFKEALDWEETKTTFIDLKEAVYPESEADPKKCQKKFDEKYQELSYLAKELFRKHVAYGIAKENRVHDRAAQEQYVKKNWTLVFPLIDKALSDISRTAMREAIVSFEAEINKLMSTEALQK